MSLIYIDFPHVFLVGNGRIRTFAMHTTSNFNLYLSFSSLGKPFERIASLFLCLLLQNWQSTDVSWISTLIAFVFFDNCLL